MQKGSEADSSMATFLLTWNPKRWKWKSLKKDVKQVANGEKLVTNWSCGNSQKINIGDCIYLIRLGEEPKGIIASGVITSPPFRLPHWDNGRAKRGEEANYVEVEFDKLLHPDSPNILPRSFLKEEPNLSKMHWDTQVSGIKIPDEIAKILVDLWLVSASKQEYKLAEEVEGSLLLHEGAKRQVIVNAFERNPIARQRCIAYFGNRCVICGFSSQETYGDFVGDYIHVHHIVPLSNIQREYVVDPIKDLRPVCPNCHAAIHRRNPPFTIDEIKAMLK